MTEPVVRLRIYVGEDKMHGDQPLYRAILATARQLHCAGATLYRGIEGFGREGRLRTYEVLASEDLPVVIEIIDRAEKIAAFRQRLLCLAAIGLITAEPVEAVWPADSVA